MRWDQFMYSCMNFNFHFQDVNKEIKELDSFLRKNKVEADSAIDIGCGDGYITEKLQKILGLEEINGLDLNDALLRKAQKRGIKTICANANSIKLKKKFDIVISYGSLHHVKNVTDMIKNLAKLSKRYVLIVDNTVRDNWFHKITGSRYFILESSDYHIRSEAKIKKEMKKVSHDISVKTIKNANIWHDRTFFLGRVNE